MAQVCDEASPAISNLDSKSSLIDRLWTSFSLLA